MTCQSPPPLTPDELSAVIDGEATAGMHDHLRRCAYCTARLADARAVEQGLVRQLYRWDCPTPQQLTDFHLDLLDQAVARTTRAHVETCERCREELAQLAAFLANEAATPEVPVPRQPQRPAHPWLREIMAQLLPQAPALALRGEVKAPFMAQAGEVVIVLDVQAADEAQGMARFTLTGQLAAPEQDQWTGALVLLRRAGETVQTAVVDDLGEFRLAGVEVGGLALRITPPAGATIVLPALDIGGRGEWKLTSS